MWGTMNKRIEEALASLCATHTLPEEEYLYLLQHNDEESRALAAEYARTVRERFYGKDVYIRGLIEISNYCKNDCLYCGIRRSNKDCFRYRLTQKEILECCEIGYPLGFRTFVLQGGEDAFFTDEWLEELIYSKTGINTMTAEEPMTAVAIGTGKYVEFLSGYRDE